MSVALPLILLVVLLLGGIPVGFTLLLVGALGVALVASPEAMFGTLASIPYRSTASYALVTIPMFVLMANFITKGGLGRDIFASLRAWSGRTPGGSVIATIYASAGLGAICGSSAAAASTMGQVAIPELKEEGYTPQLAVGAVAAAGTLAIMIPPSTALILYAVLTEQSIGAMLLAGVLPGLLLATAMAGAVLVWAARSRRNGVISARPPVPMREKLRSIRLLWPFVLLIVTVIGGIYTGVVSSIEASALGAVVALALLVVIRRITWPEIVDSLRETAYTTAMIFVIIIGAHVFGQFLAISRVPTTLLEGLTSAGLNRWAVLVLILAALLFMGFFMDQIAILSLALPLVFPVIVDLDFNPIWFGVLFVLVGEIGLITPPMGLNVFVASAAGKESPEVGFRGIWPFAGVMMIVLVSLVLFPDIATVLLPSDL